MASDADIVAKPLRHPWRWVSAILITAILGLFIYSLWASPNINHDIVSQYLFNGKVIAAAWLTVVLTSLEATIAANNARIGARR